MIYLEGKYWPLNGRCMLCKKYFYFTMIICHSHLLLENNPSNYPMTSSISYGVVTLVPSKINHFYFRFSPAASDILCCWGASACGWLVLNQGGELNYARDVSYSRMTFPLTSYFIHVESTPLLKKNLLTLSPNTSTMTPLSYLLLWWGFVGFMDKQLNFQG